MSTGKIHLAILNITSWCGYDASAEHLYGHLILSDKEQVTLENVHDWNVRHIGEQIELSREMTFDEAKKLDAKDQSGGRVQRRWMRGEKDTTRFDSFEQVVASGIALLKSSQFSQKSTISCSSSSPPSQCPFEQYSIE